jgi:hypothetical protein
VQVRWKGGPVDITGAVTQGTLSNPRLSDDNTGKQLVGRVTVTPAVGLILGVSGAGGAWLSRTVPGAEGSQQRAFGADVEYSRDHWILRSELVYSRWSFPQPLPPSNGQSLSGLGTWVEGRYRLTPRIFIAGRADRLGFSRLTSSTPGTPALPWDAPVTRLEAGGGFYLQRNLVARATVQTNSRAGGRVTDRTFVSGQLIYWF